MNLVSSDDIAHIVSKWTGIPIERMVENDKNRILGIESELQKNCRSKQCN